MLVSCASASAWSALKNTLMARVQFNNLTNSSNEHQNNIKFIVHRLKNSFVFVK